MADLCDHGDIPSACLDCLHAQPPERANPHPDGAVAITPSFYAGFPGDCAGCGLGIHEGQRIVRMSNDSYRHESCAT